MREQRGRCQGRQLRPMSCRCVRRAQAPRASQSCVVFSFHARLRSAPSRAHRGGRVLQASLQGLLHFQHAPAGPTGPRPSATEPATGYHPGCSGREGRYSSWSWGGHRSGGGTTGRSEKGRGDSEASGAAAQEATDAPTLQLSGGKEVSSGAAAVFSSRRRRGGGGFVITRTTRTRIMLFLSFGSSSCCSRLASLLLLLLRRHMEQERRRRRPARHQQQARQHQHPLAGGANNMNR